MSVVDEVLSKVDTINTPWRAEGERDDDQGVDQWRDVRRDLEDQLQRAMQWHRPFDAAVFYRDTRTALIDLAAVAIAQVNSLDRLQARVS